MNIVALDIGGTNIRAAIIDTSLNIIKVIKERTLRQKKQDFIDQVIHIIMQLEINKYQPVGIAIGVPGRVKSSGYINELPNIQIRDIDLVTPLKIKFFLPVIIKNDAELAGFAEAVAGTGKYVKNTYFVTISTGIGGCLVSNHQLKNPSQEIGHTLVKHKGSYYELEKICSGDGIVKLAQLNNLNYKTGTEIFNAVRQKDPIAVRLFDEWFELIVDFFDYVNKAFTPEVIAVTGGVLQSKDLFFDKLVKRLKDANIVIAHFSEDAGLIGAAAYGFMVFESKF